MKKLLLVATVLVGGLTLAQAGVKVSIGIGLPLPPLPRPGIVIRQPVIPCPPPVVVIPPVCPPPRVIVPCPPVRYEPGCGYDHRRGYDRWERRDHGRRHRH